MKLLRSVFKPATRIAHRAFVVLAAISFVSLTSCDQVSDLVGKAKGMISDDEGSGANSKATVDKVNEQEAKTLMGEEPRMVIVEFYTDT